MRHKSLNKQYIYTETCIKLTKLGKIRYAERQYIGSVYLSKNMKRTCNYCMEASLEHDTLLARWHLFAMVENLKSRISDNNKMLCGVEII